MKVVLLSDASMCVDAGGISQTLYNLFSFVKPQNLLCVTPHKEFVANPPSAPFASRYITYKFEIINIPRNRIAKYVTPFINWLNFSYNSKFQNFEKIQQQILQFKPDVIISCPNTPVGLLINNKLLQNLSFNNVIPYFMDDWMYNKNMKWVEGNVQKSVKQLLLHNNAWLMISCSLAEILEERYKIKPKTMLELHNPVDLSDVEEYSLIKDDKEFLFAYAGALWPMHFDSFLVVAKALTKITFKKKIKLVVYTSAAFWKWRKQALEPQGVEYGGSIPYRDIHNKLKQANALILVSSFQEKYYSVSKSSLQTKVTDYLKARRLIISCGPAYSANHAFLKKYECGVCIETNDVDDAAIQLEEVFKKIDQHQVMIENGWNLLKEQFTFDKVHKKLVSFLRNAIQAN